MHLCPCRQHLALARLNESITVRLTSACEQAYIGLLASDILVQSIEIFTELKTAHLSVDTTKFSSLRLFLRAELNNYVQRCAYKVDLDCKEQRLMHACS
jgi:hypothetical protein